MMVTQLHVQIDNAKNKQTDIYLFAHADDAAGPVGMLVLGLEDGENTGWVSRLFVDAAYRRMGIAKELLKWADLISREKGRSFLSLSVSDENKEAQNLYKSIGFQDFMKGQVGYLQYIKAL